MATTLPTGSAAAIADCLTTLGQCYLAYETAKDSGDAQAQAAAKEMIAFNESLAAAQKAAFIDPSPSNIARVQTLLGN